MMIQTHKGHTNDSRDAYYFEVLKEGHILTLVVEKNGVEIERVWCHDIKEVRSKISSDYTSDYVLEKIKQ